MIDSTNPRIMADNIKELAAASGGTYTPAGYSTEEVNTGIKWINESPIYRLVKTFSSSDITSETGGGKVAIGSITPDEIISLNVSLTKGTFIIPTYQGSTLFITCFITIDDGTTNLHLRYGSDVASELAAYFANSKVILEYTKADPTKSTKRTTKK